MDLRELLPGRIAATQGVREDNSFTKKGDEGCLAGDGTAGRDPRKCGGVVLQPNSAPREAGESEQPHAAEHGPTRRPGASIKPA